MARRERANDTNARNAASRITGFGRARRQSRPTLQPASQATPVATYSIAACDLDAGQWGVATQSKFLAVGAVVPWAEPHVGAIATQAYANPRYGPEGLSLLRAGLPAEEVVAADGCRRRTRSAPARDRRPRGSQRELHRRRVSRLGRRQDRPLLRRAGKHPRLGRDRRCDRRDLRGLERPAGRAPAGLPRRGPDRRRRPPGSAIGGPARR